MGSLFDLTGKVAVVTGASAGLGADAALAYAEAGADVAILARRKEKLEAVRSEIERTGRRALAVQCDVTKEEDVRNAIRIVLESFGKIDILLNNAGIAVHCEIDKATEEEWDSVFATNTKSMFFTCKYVIPYMVERGYGKIVNVSSVNAVVADKSELFMRHSYNSSKAAVLGLTTGLACSYAQYGITVNAVGPALFESEMTSEKLFKSEEFLSYYSYMNPTGRPGNKGELNGPILFLSSDASSYVQGQFIIVDGGASSV
ncbi:MAG: SDR family oxidoreductase [Oscillospiraceae bacterium]|nr:SDR family oxidoreductase [Oscillospiraceae bacterium]